MTWLLSGTTRDAVRERYRRAVVRSCLTHDHTERAALQASAHHLYAALHASAFEGAAILLLCEGDDTFKYSDGDEAPLHCTVCFLGNNAELTDEARGQIVDVTGRIAESLDPFTANVQAESKFGDVPVRLVEHDGFGLARQIALADPVVDALAASYEEHPHYLPHVSGLDDRDAVRFDRIAASLGGEDYTFPLGEPYTPAEPGYQTPDLDLDENTLRQGVMT
jgi:hypothetical protein